MVVLHLPGADAASHRPDSNLARQKVPGADIYARFGISWLSLADMAAGALLRGKHGHFVSHIVERATLDAGAWPEQCNLAQIGARHVGVDCHHGRSAAHCDSDRRISYMGHVDEPGRSDSRMARHSPHHGNK